MLHDVFVSYAREDQAAVQPYVQKLRGNDLSVWIDETLVGGERPFDEITKAMVGASSVFLFWTEASAQSTWVQKEIALAAELGKQIIPIRLDRKNFTAGARLILAGVQHIDGRRRFPEADLDTLIARIRPTRTSNSPVIAFLNMKGGVGKTTLASNIAGTMHGGFGKTVLIVDLDPQANMSNLLLPLDRYQELVEFDKSVISAFEPSLATGAEHSPSKSLRSIRAIVGAPPLPSLLAQGLYNPRNENRLDLVVGQFELFKYSLSSNLANLPGCREYFSRFIASARRQYDLVILDVAPSNSFITECAVANCTDVVAPVTPDKYALRGLRALNQLLTEAYDLPNKPRVHILSNRVGVEVNGTEANVHEEYRELALKSRIPESRFFAIRNPDENQQVRNALASLAFYAGRRNVKDALHSACEELLVRMSAA